MNNIQPLNLEIGHIVSKYRGKKSLREFAGDLSGKLPDPLSYQAIQNWEEGKNYPSKNLMLLIALKNDDWRQRMALEILAVLDPDYVPDPILLEEKGGNGNAE